MHAGSIVPMSCPNVSPSRFDLPLVSTPFCVHAGPLVWRHLACPWNLTVNQPQNIVCGDLTQDARFADAEWMASGLRT